MVILSQARSAAIGHLMRLKATVAETQSQLIYT
jgi:hypothetical protein